MAPEIILAHQFNSVKYNPFVADVWALGVLMWCVVNRSYPFRESKGPLPQQQMNHKVKIKRTDLAQEKYVYDIFYRMLDINVEERIKMDKLMKHPWIGKEVRQIEDAIAEASSPATSSTLTHDIKNYATSRSDS